MSRIRREETRRPSRDVNVRVIENDEGQIIEPQRSSRRHGKVIGRSGTTAKAIRSLLIHVDEDEHAGGAADRRVAWPGPETGSAWGPSGR